MELKNNLHTQTGWEIAEDSFNPDQLVTTGSNFMIGNGYLGYRGTFAECEAEHYVACIVTDTYDKAPDGRWRELCNAPNGLYTRLRVDGEEVSLFEGKTTLHRRTLNLKHGVFSRRNEWADKAVSLDVEKFASYQNLHLLVMRYRVEVEQPAEVTLTTGIDGRVWNVEGEHFKEYNLSTQDDVDVIETVTYEQGIQVVVAAGFSLSGVAPDEVRVLEQERRLLREITFRLEPGDVLTMQKIAAIYSSNDMDDPHEAATGAVQEALPAGYDVLKSAHQAEWDAIWEASDIQIQGNLEAQIITRFNLYHNIIATPTHARLPIGARGLSCQVYQGAAFWDQEIFNLPMYVYTRPEIARNILRYRHDTLDGARGKAQRLGYEGAFYAWTSGKSGKELFPDFFFTDILTGRPIRNHFNDWQIHISPDIVYTVWQYYQASGDWDFMVDYGAEILFEVARFLFSRVHFRKDRDRYEIIRVLGPDEYHENVDNNVFTNYQSRYALEKAVAIYYQLKEQVPQKLESLLARLELDAHDIAAWQEIAASLYLPQPNPESKVFEQFDGYFELEDTTPDTLRERLVNPDEYWGGPNGVAVHTQVLKQADVLQLFVLHDWFSPEILRANYAYYEPRTEHGSSLSPSVHSIVASKAGCPDEAYKYFMVGATIDLYDASEKVMSGGSFLGGIHTAACGAVWQMIVQGFTGLKVDATGVGFEPALPETWERLGFKLVIRGNTLDVELTANTLTACAAASNPHTLKIQMNGETKTLAPGETLTFEV